MIVKERMTRLKLIVPVIILYYTTLMLFALDYDRMHIKQWRKKEKKLVENTYTRFLENYYIKKTPINEINKTV